MKKLLVASCVMAFSFAYAQSNIEKEIVGTWSVVEIGRLMIPPNAGIDPTKVEDMRQALATARFEFGSDHHLTVQSSESQLTLDDGYWVAKGNRIAVGKWADQGRNLGAMTIDVQQRDGKWFFVVAQVAEIEVRKD